MDIFGATRGNACLFFVSLCQGYPEGLLPCRMSAEAIANLTLCWPIGMIPIGMVLLRLVSRVNSVM